MYTVCIDIVVVNLGTPPPSKFLSRPLDTDITDYLILDMKQMEMPN